MHQRQREVEEVKDLRLFYEVVWVESASRCLSVDQLHNDKLRVRLTSISCLASWPSTWTTCKGMPPKPRKKHRRKISYLKQSRALVQDKFYVLFKTSFFFSLFPSLVSWAPSWSLQEVSWFFQACPCQHNCPLSHMFTLHVKVRTRRNSSLPPVLPPVNSNFYITPYQHFVPPQNIVDHYPHQEP